jgi:methyl-accepting chemotaxis protein
MRMHSLPVKIALVAALAIATVFGIGTYFLARSAGSVIEEQNREIQNNIAYNQALGASKRLDLAARVAENISAVVGALKTNDMVDRAILDEMLKSILEKNGDLLGVWTGWEPNALDGRDQDFAKTAGNDTTGRYLPYWNRPGDKIVREVLVDYDKPGAGNYYISAMSLNRAVAIEPYLYPIGGKDVLISSFSVPIVVDGKTLGVGGVDISLESLNSTLHEIKPFGTGFVSLVSSAGLAVAHPDGAAIGKALAERDPASASAA